MESSESNSKALSDSEKESADELEAKEWANSFRLRQSADRQAKMAEMQAALASGELGDHDFDAEESTDPLSLALDEFEAADRNRLATADSEVSRANAQFVESRARAQRALQNFFVSRGDYPQPPQKLVVAVADVRNFIFKRNERALKIASSNRHDGVESNLPSAVAALPRVVDGPNAAGTAHLPEIARNDHHGGRLHADGLDEEPVKRKALVKLLRVDWPNIEACLQEQSRNGLRDAAHAKKHGYWYAGKAKAWALKEGHINGPNGYVSSVFHKVK